MVARPGNNAKSTSTPPGVAVDKIRERLKVLERLVKDLGSELESSATVSQPESHPSTDSSAHATEASAATPQTGRVILDDSDQVRYVSSGFWSRIDHELDNLKEETRVYDNDDVEDVVAGVQHQGVSLASGSETDRSPLERNGFILNHGLGFAGHDTSTLMPMASQIPYLLEVYSERVHTILALPHMPSFKAFLQKRRNGRIDGSPSEEALMFSVFYAGICSLDDEDVSASFNVHKSELLSKYRIGLEHNLAKADFLNHPSNTLIEAFNIFLALARRHESPKYVWMITGLVVRMAHYLGLHRDGAKSKHVTPFQVEMQRRNWWTLTALDMRVTEDQGSELAIPHGSYSTKSPSNVNDTDIWPEMAEPPIERYGPTDTTFLRLCSDSGRSMQESMAAGTTVTVDEHNQRLNDLKQKWDQEFLGLPDAPQHPTYLAAAGTLRVILGRFTLLSYPPVVYSSPDVIISNEIRTKLLVAAIEVAEHNHALNSDPGCQPWKWVYQTQQHWHAVVYLLIEICRRPWSSTIERAWIALHSPWLVPIRTPIDKSLGIWVPVRRLMARAREHRENEIARLQADPEAAVKIDEDDQQQIPVPSSSITFPTYFESGMFRKRWQQLVRPTAATNTSTFGSMSSTISKTQESTNFDALFDSVPDAKNTQGVALSPHDKQTPHLPTPNSGVDSSIPEPWFGGAMDLSDTTNLNSFLGTDMELDFGDLMNDANTLNFDWNEWFESAQGMI